MKNGTLQLKESCTITSVCGIKIIGNPDNGAIIGLDPEGEAFIQDIKNSSNINLNKLSQNQSMLLQALHEGDFLSGQDDVVVKKGITSAYLHVTSRCNLTCSGCYSYENKRNHKPDLATEEIKSIIDNLADSGLRTLTISGGEPFLRNDMIEILRYAKEERNIERIGCITNGTLDINQYIEASKYLTRLSISLDSSKKETACVRPKEVFDTVVEKIIELKKHGVEVAIIFTLHKNNMSNALEMTALATELGVPFSFSPLTVIEFDREKIDAAFDDDSYDTLFNSLESELEGLPINDTALCDELSCSLACGAGKTGVSISSDGGIYPCHMFNGMEDFKIGNALTDCIYNVVNSESNELLTITVDDVEQCKDCDVRYLCGGGCRFRGYALYGSVKKYDRFCSSYHKNIIKTINNMLGA